MAIAVDATSKVNGANPCTTFSWSHTCTGSNRILVVGVTTNSGADGHQGQPTGVTYNGVAMTKGVGLVANTNRATSVWYLANPASGSNTIQVTFGESTNYAGGCAVSYTGASGSIGANTGTNSASSGTAVSVAVTTTTANSYLVGNGVDNNGASWSNSGSSVVEVSQQIPDGTGLGQAMVDLSTPSVGSNTLQATLGSSNDWGIAAIEILPFSAVATTPKPKPTLLLMGVA